MVFFARGFRYAAALAAAVPWFAPSPAVACPHGPHAAEAEREDDDPAATVVERGGDGHACDRPEDCPHKRWRHHGRRGCRHHDEASSCHRGQHACEGHRGKHGCEGHGGKHGCERAGQDEDDEPGVLAVDDFRFRPTGQYRVRYRHLEGHDFVPGGVTDQLRHRARLGLEASYRDWLRVRLEAQDVRAFGEETSVSDTDADGFDMHQAYAALSPTRALELRLGRQELSYGSERLVGLGDWGESGRAFDAVRLRYEKRGTRADVFVALTRDGSAATPAVGGKQHVAALWLGHEVLEALDASVLGLFDVDADSGKRMVTLGALFTGKAGGVLDYSLEGYYQGGRRDTLMSQAAYRLAGSVRATLDWVAKPYLELYADLASGDDDTTDLTARTFVAPYATTHRYFGMMDVFVELPRDTEERGLRDVGGALGVTPAKALTFRVADHLFQAMAPLGDLQYFGHEIDVTAAWRFVKYAGIDAGYGVFFPGNLKAAAVRDAGGVEADPEHFVYATADVSF